MSEAAAAGADAGQNGGGQGGGQGEGGGAAAVADWMSDLAPEDKETALAKGWTKPGEFISSYRNLEKMVGGKGLAAPNVAEPEKLGEWEGWKQLGVPDKPDEYKIERPALEAGLQWDENFEKQARDFGTMFKLTPFQMQGMVDLYAANQNAFVAQAEAGVKASKVQVESELKAEWGKDFDQNFELARQAARHYGDISENDLDRLDGILGTKSLMKLMADVGRMNQEAALSGGGQVNFTTTGAQAEAEVARLKADAGFMEAYTSDKHPKHKEAVTRMNAARARMHGEGA